MKVSIITVAGVSSRFNKDIPEENKMLKCLYCEGNPQNTLIYQMLKKLDSYDKIIVVGGYKYSDLEEYLETEIPEDLKEKILLVYNDHFSDLSSGYSLYLGVKEALDNFSDIEEILFVEGDLDIDEESFAKVIDADKNVLTYNHEPIYSNKAVVLYQNENDEYHYLFNSDHGNLTIDEEFKAIFNSGQTWKFTDMELLKIANDNFYENIIEDTNLGIIQKYFDLIENSDDIEIIGLNHWVNCNTRKDYQFIKDYWEK
ncbi:MAG: hypothetical protein E7Z77_03770 [Methanobrevibacter sp.]|uniref:DUF6564 domain-containing protein n=1 Tax=Methanobrevibacter sp. TaxID=66852 RepID=UPI0025FFFC02|nr:DUF6564 domain-containing protein [Methanobrevibacter sp.]MBE6508514.1 hypothetical protein [Methanobrevibacter sp.]